MSKIERIIQEIIKCIVNQNSLEDTLSLLEQSYEEEIQKENIETKVVFLDRIMNINIELGPFFVLDLLTKYPNSDLYKAELLFEVLRGKKIEEIKNQPIQVATETIQKEFSKFSIKDSTIFEKHYLLLRNYLEKNNLRQEDIEALMKNLDDIGELWHQESKLIPRETLLENLLLIKMN